MGFNQADRWQQRLSNFSKALLQLEEAVKLTKKRTLSRLEEQGLIQSFEFTHELSWNVMKDYFLFQGNSEITGSRDATREAFKMQLIVNGEKWMEMIMSRNKTIHTYNEVVAKEIALHIVRDYFVLFKAFENKMKSLYSHD